MDDALLQKITAILEANGIMSLATVRPDGWPQATTVGYAHEGLTLYFLCAPESQKAKNIEQDDRVSLTINGDPEQVMTITGLSIAARAERITDPTEAQRVLDLLMSRYPAQQALPGPMPGADAMDIMRLTPVFISLIDYSKGFGHTDLVRC